MRETRIEITQGAINVNSAMIEHESENILVVSIDCSTKYADLTGIVSGGLGFGSKAENGVILEQNARTIDLNHSHPNEMTFVWFPEMNDFDIVHASGCGRYTAYVTFVRKSEPELEEN